jgi:lipopolysaccharide transport system ATP-binding protein
MSTIIKIENVSKKYVIGHQRQERYSTLRDLMMHKIRGIGERLYHPLSPNREKTTLEEFWALKDINLEIKQGDRVGIIGRNGAGKSTLLKILSRITEPTTGRIKIKGRVASLLEVGTGFHPELTGRENIFLNGAILGMSRADIKKNFDEIVAFAEVEKFLDTPVKRYSSGMYVRLAFAVAAHLKPEILIVDEVLAVGDAQFQKKCLGKMEDVGREGRTVLFVSHNMGAINQLCSSCILLDEGQIKEIGVTSKVITSYIKDCDSNFGTEKFFQKDPLKKGQLREVRILNANGVLTNNFTCDEPVIIELKFQVNSCIRGLYGYLGIDCPDGTKVIVSDSMDCPPNPLDNLSIGFHKIAITIPQRTLAPGEYRVHLAFSSTQADEFIVDTPGAIASFSLVDYNTSRGNKRAGFFSTLLEWKAT